MWAIFLGTKTKRKLRNRIYEVLQRNATWEICFLTHVKATAICAM